MGTFTVTSRTMFLCHVIVVMWASVFLVCTSSALAETGGGVAVTPARLELAMPQDGRVPPISVYNRGNETLHVSATVAWGAHDVYGRPVYDVATDVASIITVTPQSAALPPQSKLSFDVRIRDVTRSLYPVVLIDVQHPKHVVPGVTRFAVPLLLSVGEEGSIVIEETDVTFDQNEQAHYVHTLVRNIGSSHLRTGGAWTIMKEGETIAQIKMPAHVVLPGNRRIVSAKIPSLSSGTYVMQMAASMSSEQTLQAMLAVDQNGRIVMTEPYYERMAARGGEGE